VLVWAKIQIDLKQIPIKYNKRKKKIDENNGKEKVPRKSGKMPKYMPNLHYIMPNLLHLHINKLTLSIMCVKELIAKKKLSLKKTRKMVDKVCEDRKLFFVSSMCVEPT